MSTIFSSFIDADSAERAVGALLDQGADRADLSIVANPNSGRSAGRTTTYEAAEAETEAKEGLSTTTPEDVAVGAAKGASIGAGIGIAAALAAIFVPGVGLVLGGGALATALAAAAGATAAGVAAGGVVGYLKDQGVAEEYVTRYSDTLYHGGSVLAVAIPTGTLTNTEVEAILAKYGAINVGTFYAGAEQPLRKPAMTVGDLAVPMTPSSIPVSVHPSHLDSPTRQVDGSIVGREVVRQEHQALMNPEGSQVIVSQTPLTNDPLAPSTTVVVDSVSGVRRSVTSDPVSGLQTSAVVDPVTGEANLSTVVTVQTQGANATPHQSVVGAVPIVDASELDGTAVDDGRLVVEPSRAELL